MRMNDLPYALKSLRLLLLVHKPASNLRLLRQVFSSAKGFSGCFIVVVRVMHFKQARYPIGCSASQGPLSATRDRICRYARHRGPSSSCKEREPVCLRVTRVCLSPQVRRQALEPLELCL